MKALSFLFLFKLCLFAALVEVSTAQASNTLFPNEQRSPGGVAKLYFNERPDIYINNTKQNVFTIKLKDRWMVLLPLSLYKGTKTLRVVSQTTSLIQVHLILLKPAHYKRQYINVANKEFVVASKTTLERIEKESLSKKEKVKRFTPLYLNDVKMIKPLSSRLRHDFGRRRFFNGVAKSPHAGIDLSGKYGDKIRAPLAGNVILLGDLFYNGKMMLIDHGNGLMSAYSHLSKIYKEDDEWVKQGEYIAEVGASGRVTGPHLHWSVYLNSEPVNPELFLEDASL